MLKYVFTLSKAKISTDVKNRNSDSFTGQDRREGKESTEVPGPGSGLDWSCFCCIIKRTDTFYSLTHSFSTRGPGP